MKNQIRWLAKRTFRFLSRKRYIQTKTVPDRTDYQRIAYFIGGGIGDAIMAFPAIRFLQHHFPHAYMTLFVPSEKYLLIAGLFEGYRVRPLQASFSFCLLYGFPGRRFDGAFTNITAVYKVTIEFIAFLTAKKCYGFRYPDEADNVRLYDRSLPFSNVVHATNQNMQLVSDVIGVSYCEQDCRLPAYMPVQPRMGKSVIIHPGSETGYACKRWPMDRYLAIIERFLGQGWTVTVLLGPSETDMADFPAQVTMLVQPEFARLKELFECANLFVGNDSGPGHIAAWFSVPSVVLFGPAGPEQSGPLSPDCSAIYNPTICSPCHFTGDGCNDNRCMQNITVDQVWETIEKKMLNEQGMSRKL